MTDLSHPVFAQVYRAVAAAGERTGYGRVRRSVLAPATGRLLVLGLGPGHDLAHLPSAVTCVVAVEPDPAMRALSRERVGSSAVPVHLLGADGHRLPLADGSVDTVLCALVLCSVAEPSTVLAEVRRVLAPGGQLLVLEHVAAPEGHWLAPLQRVLEPLWARAAGGCSLQRDTRAAIQGAGFDTGALRSLVLRTLPPVAPHVLGRASAPV